MCCPRGRKDPRERHYINLIPNPPVRGRGLGTGDTHSQTSLLFRLAGEVDSGNSSEKTLQ